jgi:hypothetical protein
MDGIPFYALSPSVDHWATVITLAFSVLTIANCLWRAKAMRSNLPVIILLGSIGTIALEPMVDVLGSLVFPNEGVRIGVDLMGRPMPLYISLIWFFYWAGGVLFVAEMILGGITMRKWMVTGAVFVALALLIEMIPLHYRMWHYYNVQPLRVGGFPAFWGFVNTCAVMGTAAAVVLLHRLLDKASAWLLVPLFPCIAFGLNTAAGLPGYAAVSTSRDYPTVLFWTTMSMVASAAFVWLWGKILLATASKADV